MTDQETLDYLNQRQHERDDIEAGRRMWGPWRLASGTLVCDGAVPGTEHSIPLPLNAGDLGKYLRRGTVAPEKRAEIFAAIQKRAKVKGARFAQSVERLLAEFGGEELARQEQV